MTRLLLSALLALSMVATVGAAEAPASGVRTIYLVRHGQYDADPAADARLGPHLSALGVAQAHLVGARLAALPGGFDALHASPLQRARDTAAAIGEDFPKQRFDVLDDLAECTPPSRNAAAIADTPAAEQAACAAQLERVFVANFKPSSNGNRTELFVCHGNVIRYLVTRALGVDSKAWLSMSVGHASITKIRIKPDGSMQVISVGDVGHLPPNLQTGTSADPERSLAVRTLP